MTYKKHLPLLATSIIVTGCQTGPLVVNTYDEFQKRKVCKLPPQMLRHEWGMSSLRNTELSLELQQDGMIKAILNSRVIVKVIATYDNLDSKSKIKFILTTPDNKIEELIFQGGDFSITHGKEYIPIGSGSMSCDTENALMIFNMNQSDLSKIIKAQNVDFHIDAGKEPITGNLKEYQKKFFKEFYDTCISSPDSKK